MKPFLSLCMIVKNEEKVLERCLKSIHHLIDEIIIVDTGSTDKTKEIAKMYTDYIYDFQWTNNFSDARNYAQMKATGEWILVLDADEYVDQDNFVEAIQELRSFPSTVDSLYCTIYNFVGVYGEEVIQHHNMRFYRNIPSLHYIRAIHEQLVKEDGELIVLNSKLMIYHTGYMAETVREKKKSERNSLLLNKELKKSVQNPFDYFNQGNEFYSLGKLEEALNAYVNAYKLKDNINYDWVPYNTVQIVDLLVRLRRYQDALNVIRDAEKYWESAADFVYNKGIVYYWQHRYEDAKEVFLDLLNRKNKYFFSIKSPDYRDYYPHIYLGLIYEKEQNKNKAILHYSEALNYNRSSFEPLKGMLKLFNQYLQNDEIMGFLEKHNLLSNEREISRIATFFFNLGRIELAKMVAEKLNNESVAKKGVLIKSLLIEKEFQQAINELKSLSLEQLFLYLKNGLVDFYDHIILSLYLEDEKFLKIIEPIVKEEDQPFIRFFYKEKPEESLHHEYMLNLLERSITMQLFGVFDYLIPIIEKRDQKLLIKVANLFYRYEFKELAISIYQNINSLNFDSEAYINLINEFMQKEDYENALLLTLTALGEGKDDYRLYEYGIKLTTKIKNEELRKEIVRQSISIYPDSKWLKKISLLQN